MPKAQRLARRFSADDEYQSVAVSALVASALAYRPGSLSFPSFAYQFIRRKLLDERKRQQRRREVTNIDIEQLVAESSPSLYDLVCQLPEAYRSVASAAWIDQQTQKQIALCERRSIHEVRQILYWCRTRAKELLSHA